jgi:hypothetical protein
MSEAITIAIVAGVPGLIGAYLAYRQSSKAAEKAAMNEAMKVESGAYERAKSLYENGIKQLESQVERLHRQLYVEQEVATRLRDQVTELEIAVATMRRQIVNAGLNLSLPDTHIITPAQDQPGDPP